MRTLTLASPAKINLLLAVTGRRDDGFHELVSLVAPLEWGDTLTVEVEERAGQAGSKGTEAGEAGEFTLICDDPAVPVDRTNLIRKAAEAFRAATGWKGEARFKLNKRIPMGAGLGGGSSNAAAALRGLNQLAGGPLTGAELMRLAAGVGSDCALFLQNGPVVMRGRGEQVAVLPAPAADRLRGRSVLVFKPAFGISTAWAYARLAASAPASYAPAAAIEARLQCWIADQATAPGDAGEVRSQASLAPTRVNALDAGLAELLFNNLETPAFVKFPALPLLLTRLRREFGLTPQMSGSGSACFALLPAAAPAVEITGAIRQAWGESAFVIQTRLA